MGIDYEDIARRATAVSDKIRPHIRERVAFQKWKELQEWRLGDPRESIQPIDLTDFDFQQEKD